MQNVIYERSNSIQYEHTFNISSNIYTEQISSVISLKRNIRKGNLGAHNFFIKSSKTPKLGILENSQENYTRIQFYSINLINYNNLFRLRYLFYCKNNRKNHKK